MDVSAAALHVPQKPSGFRLVSAGTKRHSAEKTALAEKLAENSHGKLNHRVLLVAMRAVTEICVS